MGSEVVGIDIGGTKALAVIVAAGTEQILGSAVASSSDDGPTLINTLASLVARLGEQTDCEAAAVGLGVAGLAHRSGVVHYSPNLPELIEFPIGPKLQEVLGVRVVVGNDATAGTFAEWRHGAGQNVDNFALVTLGTGIGTGFVVDGHLLQGASGFVGESGHMVVDARGPAHVTGQQGPWEYFASGNALGRLGREAAASGKFPWGAAEAGNADTVTSQHVATGAAEGEGDALRILDAFCREVGRGLANLVLILDLELVVIGGGLCSIGEPLRAGVDYWLQELLLGSEYRPVVRVALAELGPEAGALGAALIAGEIL
ncbi:MAG: ROK family protein [Actinomycetota bacterium]|nr:ROK family protein [Actinomycetota bacterium]